LIPLDLEGLPAHLRKSRWFGGKGAEIAGVREVDRALITGDLLVLTLQVEYRGGRAAERYLLALRPSAGGKMSEALDDDDAARALLDIIRRRRLIPTAAGAVRGERFDTPGSPLDALAERPAVRRLSAEQSNTSVVFDDRVIVKLIRKLEHGTNPELEIGAFLARRKFAATPQLLGAVSLEGKFEATVAVAHRFVHAESDGWSYVVGAFRKERVPSAALLEELRQLGARVGELHAALAGGPSDPAFAPQPIARGDLERWTSALLADVDRTCALASGAVPELAARRPVLAERARRLLALAPSGLRIRQHGDLHLGQVLRSAGQWLIFDFEGEPARTLAERRERHSPLKDVAGMLRSFAYAAGTVEVETRAAGEWREPSREAFLTGWRSAAAALVPGGAQAERVLLESLELEKLLYELRYEIGHRPDWVQIPARDLLALEAL
jgi:maltokinase